MGPSLYITIIDHFVKLIKLTSCWIIDGVQFSNYCQLITRHQFSPNLSLYSSTQFLLTDFLLLDDDNSIFCSLGQNYACNWKISQSMLSIWHIFYFGGVASGHQAVQESVDEVVRTYGGVNIWNWSIETVRRRCESYREKIEYQLTSFQFRWSN